MKLLNKKSYSNLQENFINLTTTKNDEYYFAGTYKNNKNYLLELDIVKDEKKILYLIYPNLGRISRVTSTSYIDVKIDKTRINIIIDYYRIEKIKKREIKKLEKTLEGIFLNCKENLDSSIFAHLKY